MTELNHVLDPAGDLVLILNPTSLVADDKSLSKVHTNGSDSAGSPTSNSKANTSKSQEVRIRVSSKHLTLASRVFDSMFKPGFSEGDKLRTQGHADIQLPEDNPAALLILLNLLHGRIRAVPRKINLAMLTELAILVDKYELLEITEMFLDSWLEGMENSIEEEFNDDLLSWICISYAFRKAEIFQRVTKIAQLQSKGPIKEHRLPIPESVLRTIDRVREWALASIFSYRQDVLRSYQSGKGDCRLGLKCTAMILGSLTIRLTAIGILQLPEAPYNGFCFKTLAQQLREMEILRYCESYARCEGVMSSLHDRIMLVERQLIGLQLNTLQSRK
ncbi:hypothetical protein MMC27_000168 [Xylographa pallens]|nr:hypothetical protein [Xylographa pallens]